MSADEIRRLIVNADDFGRSPWINDGIARAHRDGIVTSASLMVRWPAADAAAAYARSDPTLSVGLHLDLGEWTVVDGEWRQTDVVLSDGGGAAVRAELDRQLAAFRKLLGRAPTHIDSHQHVHREEPVRSAVIAQARRLAVPVRDFSSSVAYMGDFYGQYGKGEPYPEGISRGRLLELIRALPRGVTELGCHPASQPELDSSYAHERPMELSVLCDPAVAAALVQERIELCSFADLVGLEAP